MTNIVQAFRIETV